MQLTVEDLPNGVTKAVLVGRLDIDGAAAVDMRFNVLAGAKRALVVDLSQVDFIASMGLRTLMSCARSIASKGGRMALAGPQDHVLKVLATSGVQDVIPVRASVDDAIAYVTS
ncbi:MAG TPA: STAS domain-containing protein [Caulobacterales bacterium]|nr:STAS domain-containing protein [Caulobacterales bacterium]